MTPCGRGAPAEPLSGALLPGAQTDPSLGTLGFKLTGSQPPTAPPPSLARWGQLPGSDSTGKLMSSGSVLLGPVEGRLLRPGQRPLWPPHPAATVQGKVGWGSESRGPAAAPDWQGGDCPGVGTELSPVPGSPRTAPGFRLSHGPG